MVSRGKYADFWFEDGILICHFKNKLVMNRSIAEEIIMQRISFAEGKDYPMLLECSDLKFADKNAREYMSSPNGGLKCLKAGVFMTNSIFNQFLINTYLKISKPAIPARMFTNREDGIKWLMQFR